MNNEDRKTLHEIKEAQAAQAKIEAERAGASKLGNRLVAVFGSVITAAAIAAFIWVWDASASSHVQAAQIERIDERAHEHDPSPPGHGEIDDAIHDNTRRVDSIEQAQTSAAERMSKIERATEQRHNEVMREFRLLRNRNRR